MSKRRDTDYINDILEAINRIVDYTNNMTYEDFMEDFKTQDAVIRNIEIIGEATKNVSTILKNKYPKVPWKDMAGVRDKLIHHYFGLNYDIIWKIAKDELPPLCTQLAEIL